MEASNHLPSPPSTSHRDEKENRRIFDQMPRVSWSQENQIHPLFTSPLTNLRPSASCEQPVKSILRKSSSFPFTDLHREVEREVTPEPETPLSNSKYLSGPVSRIIMMDAGLKDLIQAYNILAARIRTAFMGVAEVDPTVPLFDPLRSNRDLFTDAVVRDLGRAMVDPALPKENRPEVSLPSPRPSPSRKRHGMTEDEVRYARDLATTTHSVVKLITQLFAVPHLCQIFSDDNLDSMLTALLAIPMADRLPTPNARKTCALTIWFMQVQRLPPSVLAPAKDRIAYSLRRGIEGELGKEGKKGSVSDGLKAVHDLSLYQPDIFIPSFVDLLPSVLSSLLAATLPLRVQACHALGGFVHGLLSIPRSSIHTRVSETVASFLLAPSTPKKSGSESEITRTLRTLLGAQEATHPANGPVWALVVVGCFAILLGPRAYADQQIFRIFFAQCGQIMRHRRSTIRAMGCLLWRCLAWVYVQSPLPPDPTGLDEDEEEEVETLCHPDDGWPAQCRAEWWSLVQSVLEMRTGVSTIACLLSAPSQDGSGEFVHSILHLLGNMVRKGGMLCGEAVHVVQKLVSAEPPAVQWEVSDPTAILPAAFLDAYPGPLSADFQNISFAVKPILDGCVTVDCVRPLTTGELAHDAVFKGLVALWREGLRAVIIEGDMDPPSEVLHIWDRLLRIRFGQVEELEADTNTFIHQLSGLLLDILADKEIAPSPHQDIDGLPSPSSSPTTPRRPPMASRSNAALKIFLMRHLWRITRDVLPLELLQGICAPMLSHLKEHHTFLVPGLPGCPPGDEDALGQWGRLCAELLMGCRVGSVVTFMGATKIFKYDLKRVKRWVSHMRSVAWRHYAEKWMDMSEDWDEAVSVLLLPITAGNEPWAFSGEDVRVWERLFTYTLDKALDDGAEPGAVLEEIAATVHEHHTPTWTSAARIVDLIISKLNIENLKETSALKLANQTLTWAYSTPQDTVITTWLIRSLTRIVEESPSSLAPSVLDQVQEGLSLWFADEGLVFSTGEYEFDVLMSYQTILLVIQGLPRQMETVDRFSTIIGAPFRSGARCPGAIVDTFNEFWGSIGADINEPEVGWPTPIKAALQTSRQGNKKTSATQDPKALERTGDEHHDDHHPQQQAADETPSGIQSIRDSGSVRTAGITVDNSIRPHPRCSTTVCESPSTPRKERPTHVSTPPRRHRTTSSPKILYTLGPEPRSPLRDIRKRNGSSASFHASPTPKASDKENVSPKPLPDIFASVLGKRKMEPTIEDSATRAKRKIGSSKSLKTVRTAAVTGDRTTTENEDPVESPVSDCVTNTPSKKRKSEVFAGVVVPTMKEVILRRRHSAPLREMGDSQSPDRLVSPGAGTLRKSRSFARMDVVDHRDGDLEASPRKKIRTIRSGEAITPMLDFPVAGSDDSIVTVDPSAAAVNLSSDDDPMKLGRYTPRVLVSPVLNARRLNEERWDEADIGSDDSVEPNSPTKDVVERRKKMGWPGTPRAADRGRGVPV